MIATLPTFRKSALFDVSSDDLVLRISGSSRNGQIVRLKSTKCTIGSGPQCTLRLRAAGVAPLHCLLLRGRMGTIVRCWSPDTRLNHHAFSDAVLSPGDRLGVGPIELEVLGLGATFFVEKPKIKREDGRHGADAERKELEERLAKLETEQNALTAERDAMAEQRRQWETERNGVHQTVDAERKELEERLAKLETEQNALAAERDAMAEQRRQWEKQQAELAERHEPVLPENLPVESPERETQDTEAPRFESSSERAPVDLNEVFRRIGAKVELAEEDALTPDPSPSGRGEKVDLTPAPYPSGQTEDIALAAAPSIEGQAEEVAHTPAPSVEGQADEEGDNHEESIDDYMGRLMQRIRGGAAEPLSPSVVEPLSTPASTTSSIQESVEPSVASPRTKAPENRIDLTALRELANLSARSAIGQHTRKVLVHTIYSKLMVAAVGVIASVTLLWLWQQCGAWEMTFYTALVAILVAIYWGVQYALLTGRLIIDKSGSIDLGRHNSSHTAPSDEPPKNASPASRDVSEQT